MIEKFWQSIEYQYKNYIKKVKTIEYFEKKMFQKAIPTLANAGTVALLGYEFGAKHSSEEFHEIKTASEKPQIIIESNNHHEVVIFGILYRV